MKPIDVRRWVHRFVGAAALVLISTGTLVTFPDFRSAVIGGNGQLLSDMHMWIGFLFISAPIAALLIKGKDILSNLKKRIIDAKRMTWRRFHLTLTIISGSLMTITGGILLIDSHIVELSTFLMDIFFFLHLTGAWILGLTLPVHLFMSRRGIAHTLKKWLGMDKKTMDKKSMDKKSHPLKSEKTTTTVTGFDQGIA